MRTGMEEKPQFTIAEHVQRIRDGVDYKSPLTALNPTIEGLVHCALVVRDHEVDLTPETRALDAIGVQVERELGNRKAMILALVDRVNTLEAYVRDARQRGYITDAENMQLQEPQDIHALCDRVEQSVERLEQVVQGKQGDKPVMLVSDMGGATV